MIKDEKIFENYWTILEKVSNIRKTNFNSELIYIHLKTEKRFNAKESFQCFYISVISQPAHDVPGTSPEGPLKVLTSGTSRGPSGDSQGTNTKIDDLMKKLFFRCNSPCFTHLFLIFTEKTNIQKFLMGTSTGRLRDPVARRPGDQMMGRSGDVRMTSVKNVCKFNSQTH